MLVNPAPQFVITVLEKETAVMDVNRDVNQDTLGTYAMKPVVYIVFVNQLLGSVQTAHKAGMILNVNLNAVSAV